MLRFYLFGVLAFLAVVTVFAGAVGGLAWWLLVAVTGALLVLGIYDVVQTRHSILRNYPILGHVRYLLEGIRPELQQYFIERNYDGRPFDRDTRTAIYQRAKGTKGQHPFGTERDVYRIGYEYLVHSAHPKPRMEVTPSVRIGGRDCALPYDIALANISSMSFGSLSSHAVEAMNRGAAAGGFAHETGEGGISPYHRHGGDLVWEIGSGYFGCRTPDGHFDEQQYVDVVRDEQVKMTSIKLSQGAKPGLGGVLPGAKVNREIAATRGIPVGETCVSPPYHSAFGTPRELLHFVARLRELSEGRPVGFKLCVGSRVDVLAIAKAMVAEDIRPDFIVVDGAEGGTGAAPLAYQDHVGMPLTEGLMTVHEVLTGVGLRETIKIGAAGKVTDGMDIVKRLIQGADYTLSARAMMMAVGCIQAQTCHTNTCPVGVATQDPKRVRALHVPSKAERVTRYQDGIVVQATQVLASMGLDSFDQLAPRMLRRQIDHGKVASYAELFDRLEPGQLLDNPPPAWREEWEAATADRFTP
ncbi:FMN-binding glutamate synthase family protein [Nocardioides panacisoli]|uniref:FMN-binding glutamate synthase family protein n=1 Tax=Nocardioides panacisoli TaxID=627624 RepID=UPI001C639D72|nr:FMN-binding glutamate synthase family protein [Nocardioides panacisoli]QYJ05438.1 FMN-binding glutamate synthase family protein [Nocardioides panacisoli]